MLKIFSIFSLSLFLSLVSVDTHANHCSGGHKEIKDTKDTTSEDSKEASSNSCLQRFKSLHSPLYMIE